MHGPERPSQEVLFAIDYGLGTLYRQTGDEASRGCEVLHVERQDVSQSMHLTDGNKTRIVDLRANNAGCLRQRFPRDVYLWNFRQDWKLRFEREPFGMRVLWRQA